MQENTTGPIARVHVTGTGVGVTGQAGTHLLGRVANRIGIHDGLSAVMDGTTVRSTARRRGTVLTQLSMMIAAGGRCLSDLKTLRDQPALFGDVASDATAWRTINNDCDDVRLDMIPGVRQAAIRRLLDRAGLAEQDEVVLDVDATLLHLSDDTKEGAAPTFKRGFGFAPMLCFIEPFGLPAGMLRPGNHTANNAADHLAVVDQAIASLPEVFQTGHRPGDQPDRVQRRVIVRTDTAGGTTKTIRGLADRNIVFSVGLRSSQARAAVMVQIPDDVWQPAINTDGKVRDGAHVAEVPDLVPAWAPAGTRAIVRRERPHPGASLRLWDHDGLRRQVTLTNDTDFDIVALELAHRAHAQVENRIKNFKDTGLGRLPFRAWHANLVWFELVLLAAVLLAGLQTFIADPGLSRAEPRRLRYTLLAIAARIVHRHGQVHVRLDRTWPWTHVLVDVHRQLDTMPATAAA